MKLSAYKYRLKEYLGLIDLFRHKIVYYDRNNVKIEKEDEEGVIYSNPFVTDSYKDPLDKTMNIFLDYDVGMSNITSKKIKEMNLNLSPADLEVINKPVGEIHRYFMEIKAIPVDAFEQHIRALDLYFSDKISKECVSEDTETDRMQANDILCDILKQFDLKRTLKAYQKVQKYYG